jgi:hypothetical protein
MTAATPFVRHVEAAADVEAIDMLHADRRQIIKNMKHFKAWYGAFGMYDDYRKQYLSTLIVTIKDTPEASGAPRAKPMSDKEADARAHAHPKYREFLDRCQADRIRYIQLDVQLTEIEERIRSRDLEIQHATRSLRLET